MNEAKKRYRAKVERLFLELYPTDADIKQRLDQLQHTTGEPKATYIKRLIREDIRRHNKELRRVCTTTAMEGPNRFETVEYTPMCRQGYEDCIHDPAYIKATYPEWYAELYGKNTRLDALVHTCDLCKQGSMFDDEDK